MLRSLELLDQALWSSRATEQVQREDGLGRVIRVFEKAAVYNEL
jgi:hypothetical protein